MPTKIIHPQKVSELADIVEAYYEMYENNRPSRSTYDAVAKHLGIADTCTGDPKTANESATWEPKTGLSVSFHSVNPTGEDNEAHLMNAYYVATWRGEIYRGHILLSNQNWYAKEPDGFLCWDRSAYTESLPDGCRKLVAQLVTDAVKSSGISLVLMRKESEKSAKWVKVLSEISRAKWSLDKARRIQEAC